MTSIFRFDGSHVVVTGGASGVGAALLRLLHDLGAPSVTVIDRTQPTGPHAAFIPADLGDPAQVDQAVARIDGRVDVLFNNAGVADTSPPETVFAVNFLAVRRLTRLLADRIVPGGAVVNTGSIAGIQWPERLATILELLEIDDWSEAARWFAARDDLGAPYGFTKECIHVYTMQAARSLGEAGVRINSVSPAPIDTPLLKDFRQTMTDALIDWTVAQSGGRIVTADEVAATLAFLASDAAGALSGLNIPIDHGFNAAMTTGQLDFSALGG